MAKRLTLYDATAPKALNEMGISLIMVGVATSDSTRISFLGNIRRELAQKLGRGQENKPISGLLKCPPNRAE